MFQETDDRYGVKEIVGMRFHLRVQALLHFGNALEKRSVVFYRRVRQAVRAIVDCLLEAMVYWIDHFQLLIISAITALAVV